MLLALGGISFGTTIELFHSAREAADGEPLRRLGLGGARAAFAMLAVNAAVGVLLCESLADDAELPKGSLFDGVYWSVVIGTSVGFGDFHPTSDLERSSRPSRTRSYSRWRRAPTRWTSPRGTWWPSASRCRRPPSRTETLYISIYLRSNSPRLS